MRRHPVTGQIAHGIAGDGVYVDGVQIAPGGGQSGMPDWMGDQVLHCAEAGVTLRSADGSSPALVGVPANFVRASSHGWASWSPERGVFTSWGLTLPSAVLLDMAPDGTMLVGDNYQSGVGISAYRSGSTTPLWRVPTARPELRFPYSQAAILDDKTACWTENVGGRQALVGFGLTAGPRPPWNVLHARLFKVNGEVWVVYLRSEDDRTIAHPWNYVGLGFSVPGFGYGPEGWQDGALVTLAWSIGAGEKATDIKGQTFNLAALETIPSLPPPVQVKPIGPLGPPLPEGTWINVAEFFALDGRCWPRGDKARGDTHGMDMQAVRKDGLDSIWYAKFDKDGKGRSGELLSVDDDPDGYIHWRGDCSNAGEANPDGSVKVEGKVDLPSDTRWLRKRMQIGRRYGLDVGWHKLRVVRRSDGGLIHEIDFNREQWIVAGWDRFWLGEDFGEGRAIRYCYNNTGQREGFGQGIEGHHVETYWMGIAADGRVVGWGDWSADPAPVVFATRSAVFPDPPTVNSDFWHKGGQRFPPDLPPFPMPRAVPNEVPTPMKLPTDVQATIRAFAAINPLPQGPADDEHWMDTALRHLPGGWLARCVQTVVFFHGGDYGQKRRGGGAPISAGRIARREPGGFRDFDILIAAASGRPTLNVDVESEGLITDQEFVPIAPFNHLADGKPRPGRATWPAAVKHGVSGFDVAARLHGGDSSYYDLTAPLPLNVFVYTTIVHPETHRLGRTLAQGLAQTETLLKRLTADGRQAMFIMICGPMWVNNGPKPTRAEILDAVRQQVALFLRYPKAVLALSFGNELYQSGFEAPEMLDPSLWAEVEAIVPLQFPFAIGQVGDAVVFGPGSVAMMHPNRGMTSAAALQILADAQARDGRVVVAREPARIEAGGSGQSRGDINFVREELANAKRLDLPYFLHPAAGRGCYVPAMDNVQREALALLKEAAKGTPTIPPPQGHPILDFDMSDHAGFYRLFISKRREIEALAVAWYTKSRGHAPAESDISHGFYWRSMREWSWFGTLRRAFEDTWPGGAP